ncbi:MAG: sorbosone dehydrogenase family protein, partial [Mesorhizobium sp.]|nr:sorbosone dehydrogenase family protein [Mesorhizobium sp.]
MLKILAALVLAVVLAFAGVFYFSREEATVPIEQSYGPSPVLPEPNPTLIPTVNIATATSWPEGVM